MKARDAKTAAIFLFCAALPLSIAGANMGWALVAATLIWIWRDGTPPRWSSVASPALAPLCFFLAASATASLLGVHPIKSLSFFNQDAHKLWLACLLLLALDGETSSSPAIGLGLGFTLAALIGLSQATASLMTLTHLPIRAHAFSHPVTFGEQMAVGLLGAFSFFLTPPSKANARLWRQGSAVVAALAAAALVMSNTRGALVAATAGFVAIFLAAPDKRRYAVLAIPVGAAVLLAAELMRWDRSVLRAAYAHFYEGAPLGPELARISLWETGIRIGLDHPWTGVGHNAFRTVFHEYFSEKLDGSMDWGTAHCLYIHHFAERGILGLCALVWLFWRMGKRALERAIRKPDAWTLWAWGTIVAFFVMNLTEVALQVEAVWMLVFFVWFSAEARFRRG